MLPGSSCQCLRMQRAAERHRLPSPLVPKERSVALCHSSAQAPRHRRNFQFGGRTVLNLVPRRNALLLDVTQRLRRRPALADAPATRIPTTKVFPMTAKQSGLDRSIVRASLVNDPTTTRLV
ncbi:uncharacterized protein LOC144148819 [Haemaphysalis longicornis]